MIIPKDRRAENSEIKTLTSSEKTIPDKQGQAQKKKKTDGPVKRPTYMNTNS